jgi:hypothetical protein
MNNQVDAYFFVQPSLRCQAHYANIKFRITNSYMRLRKEPSNPSLPLGESGVWSIKFWYSRELYNLL